MASTVTGLYLCHFTGQVDVSIAIAELDALLALLVPHTPREEAYMRTSQDTAVDPFVVVRLPSVEVALALRDRATCIKYMYELWSTHDCHTLHEAVASVAALPSHATAPWFKSDVTWRVGVNMYGATATTNAELTCIRNHFMPVLPFTGRVRLKDAECAAAMTIIIDCGLSMSSNSYKKRAPTFGRSPTGEEGGAVGDTALGGGAADAGGLTLQQRRYLTYKPSTLLLPNAVIAAAATPTFTPELCADSGVCTPVTGPSSCTAGCGAGTQAAPAAAAAPATSATSVADFPGHERKRVVRRVFVGRWLGETARQHLLFQLSLPRRAYLGPTTLDPQIALVMCNMAHVTKGSWVYDPFVGTGSVLVAAAKFGAFAWGSDIDMRVLRGKGGKDISTNFAQYGLGVPELVRLDNSMPSMLQRPLFDAIVTDPPYGVRAGARKSGVAAHKTRSEVPEEERYRPRTQVYDGADVMNDLLDRAARLLCKGGFLSYLYPAMFDHKTEDLPWHPCLEVVSDAEDKLNMMLSRRVVSMRKVADYDYAKADEYRAAVAARAEERGLAGVGLKSRLATAYDSWYDVHKEELVTVPAAPSALTSDAGAAGAAGTEAALTSDVKRYVLNADAVPELDSKRSQKQHRRRLLRQAKRLERVVAESERSASSAGAPDEEGGERAATPSA